MSRATFGKYLQQVEGFLRGNGGKHIEISILPNLLGQKTPSGCKLKSLLKSEPQFHVWQDGTANYVKLIEMNVARPTALASAPAGSKKTLAATRAEDAGMGLLARTEPLNRKHATAVAGPREAADPAKAEALRTFFQPRELRSEQPRTTLYLEAVRTASNAPSNHTTLLQSPESSCIKQSRPASLPSKTPTSQATEIERALLGHVIRAKDGEVARVTGGEEVHMNVTDPFCLVTVGVQGTGKSHSVGCILEACLLRQPPISSVRQPMAALVCHFDQSENSQCEALGLGRPSTSLRDWLGSHAAPQLSPDKMLVLCSPSFHRQRRQYYGDLCEVRPLLFRWGNLKAQHIKTLMHLNSSPLQLYAALMLDKLRGYQRVQELPAYEDFVTAFQQSVESSQASSLRQRFQLLSSFVREAECNAELRGVGADLTDAVGAGKMVVVDLTDPMLTPDEANSVFHVLLDTFRSKDVAGAGKIVLFDEAHRYMGLHGTRSDLLSHAITDSARLMRHEGMRLLVSTQSPKALPQELLELTSVLIAHRYQSQDWHAYLSKKLPLPQESFETIRGLPFGDALVYSSKPAGIGLETPPEVFRLQIRQRLTADLGATSSNREPDVSVSDQVSTTVGAPRD